jgi:hypothetical protein
MLAHGYEGWTLDYSPSMVRKAYYSHKLHFSEFIAPLDPILIEQGRHTIWMSPKMVKLIQRKRV